MILNAHKAFAFYMAIFISFALSYVHLQGQVISPVIINHHQSFRFDANARVQKTRTINDLLQILAEGNGKLRAYTSYDFHSDVAVVVTPANGRQLNISVEVRNPKLSGDTKYKDLNIEKYLVPPFVDIDVILKTKDNRVYREEILRNIPWQGKTLNQVVETVVLDGRSLIDYTVELKETQFHYGDNYAPEIESLGVALSSYYRGRKKIAEIDSIISGIDPNKFETAILDEFRLCEAEILLSKLINEPLHSIVTEQADPESFLLEFRRLTSRMEKLRYDFNQVISKIDSLNFDKGRMYLLSDWNKAREYFERAVNFNPFYMPAHIELGRMDIDAGRPVLALNRFEKLFSVIQIPVIWEVETELFIDYMFESESKRARVAMNDGRFLDALKILAEVEKFCTSVIFYKCSEELYSHISEAHYGMYRSYLSVARRAYMSGNYLFATTYIKSALNYRLNSSNYITDDKEAMDLLQKVLDGYYSLADQAFTNSDFSAATVHLQAAQQLYESYPTLTPRINADRMLAQAEIKKHEEMPVVAEIQENSVPQNIVTPSMSVEEATAVVRDLLSQGHLKAWAGDVKSAKEILNNILSYAVRFDLRTDFEINTRIHSLLEMITKKECELALNDIRTSLYTARDYFSKGLLTDARNSFIMANQISDGAGNCSWNMKDTLKQYHYIELAGQYQLMIHEAQGAYYSSGSTGMDMFIEGYRDASRFYEQNQLLNYGVKHVSLADFTARTTNTILIQKVIRELADTGRPEEALQLFRVLKQQGYDARQLKELMEYAGSKAAANIYSSQPQLSASDYLATQLNNDPWFRIYSRSFVRNWPD